ncbi:MAG TPA: alpha/beta hydrolase [Beijerinckiaceae bacterium]|jgi:pimeloyl-ACP methyl ester carboxylesterase|nr:alpha/beta hydrolase [Beijerinckiaceae bacterium]
MSELVLVPGVNNTRETWKGVITALPATITSHPVDCAALPSVEEIAADLLERAPPRFHLAGFSFGGYVALAMLEQAPERIEGLALICTSSFADTEQQRAARDAAAAAAERGEHMKLVEGPGAIALHPDAAGDPAIAALRLRIARDYGEKRFIAHQYASKARPDRTVLLATASMPCLLVAAEDDRVIPLDTMRRMQLSAPRARWVSVPRAGHLLPIEQPVVLAEALRHWIEPSQSTQRQGRVS